MKKILVTIFLIVMILAVAGVALVPQPTYAFLGLPDMSVGAMATEITAWIGNIMMAGVGFLLTVTATLLSFSIKLTLNIKDIYEGAPAIRNVWVIIRNISSMFIIFMLLFTSIQTILNIGSPNIKKLVGNIIMAGLLINFSLFFTKVLIDGSNLVSMQFYRAIAPQSASQPTSGWFSSFNDGGLSDIFMSSLQIQKIYHPENTELKNINTKGETTIFFSIIIATYGGIVLMLFAAISFLAAAVAFSIRTGALLLLMAFSPIYFAGMIFPTIKKEISDKWLSMLTQQLLFMPIYLLLMYVSLTIISDKGFLSFIQSGSLADTSKGSTILLIGVVIQYVIAIFFINTPLLAAIKFGAIGTKFAEGMTKGLKDRIYRSPKTAGSFAGQHLIGRGAKNLQSAVASSGWATKNPNLAIMANKTFGKVASSTFGGAKGGYDKRFKDYSKEREDYVNKGLKLSGSEKDSAVKTGLASWEERKQFLIKEIAKQKALISDATSSDKDIQTASIALVKLEAEEKARKEAFNAGTESKYLEGEALKDKKDQYATSLEKQTVPGFFTNKARKEAVDSFRKEASKSEDKKLLEKLQKLAKDAEKESKAEEKEKPKP